MNKFSTLLIIIIFAGLLACGRAVSDPTIIQWRGIDRSGVFHETGLMTSWAEDGPELLWHFDGLGYGLSSPVIVGNRIFVTGMSSDNIGSVLAFDLNGRLLNRQEYGQEWSRGHPGARSTIAPSATHLYFISGVGVLYAIDQRTLNVVWSRDLQKEFGAPNTSWGFTESPLVVGDKVIATPGGEQHNVVAFNKNTGEVVWSTAGMGSRSSYISAAFIGSREVPLVVQMTEYYTLGIHADTGEMLWAFPYLNPQNGHANTPVYRDDMLLLVSGSNTGATMLRLLNGGRAVEEVWRNRLLDNRIGGVVRVGDYIYGSGHWNRYWFCINWYTGEIMWQESDGAGITIAADEMLYIYTMRGDMKLARPTPEKFDIVSQFPITLGTDEHIAHPIIYGGVLYVRRGNALMAFDLRE
jgi:outer membrane protein assembly factor BamB